MEERKLVNISNIDEGERGRKELGDLESLIESIETYGLFHDILLYDKQSAENWEEHNLYHEEKNPDAQYLLLAGGRRLAAFKKGEISEQVPAKIFKKALNAYEIKTIELQENLEREDLTYDEEIAMVYEAHRLYEKIYGEMEGSGKGKSGHSLRDTARMLNRSPSSVSEDIQLHEAMQVVPEMFEQARNKSEAKKIFNKAKKAIDDEEQAQKIREKRERTSSEKLQKEICDRFQIGKIPNSLSQFDDGTFSLVELDPPLQIGFEDIYNDDMSYKPTLNVENYLTEMEKVLKESYRVMKQHAWIIVWYPIEPFHEPLWKLMQKVGFKVRSIPLLWDKNASNTRSPNYNLGNGYEVAFYGRKGDIILNQPGRSNIFKFKRPSQSKRYHKTEKPIELYMEIFRTFARKGSMILAGYAGSGNALLAAENIDMTAFGFDIVPDLKNKFDLKVHEDLPPNYTSYA